MAWTRIFGANPIHYPGFSGGFYSAKTGDEYMVRFVHKIAPRDDDVEGPVRIPDNAFSNKRTLAKALRMAGILGSGDSIRSMRVEGDKIIVFPGGWTGKTWNAIVLTKV